MTSEYVEMMVKSKFYKEGYSHTPPDELRKDTHYPMILTKLPFKLLVNEERVVICLFSHKGIDFLVVNAHLTANEDRTVERIDEMRAIGNKLRHLPQKIMTR